MDIPESARKRIDYLFLRDIVVTVYKILLSLILNLEQTPLKYLSVGNETMASGGAKSATIKGSSDKLCHWNICNYDAW